MAKSRQRSDSTLPVAMIGFNAALSDRKAAEWAIWIKYRWFERSAICVGWVAFEEVQAFESVDRFDEEPMWESGAVIRR